MNVCVTFYVLYRINPIKIKMLEKAKGQCDYLIVGMHLNSSLEIKKNSPSQSIIKSYLELKECKHIDEIIPYVSDQDQEDILRSFNINLKIIGEEYKDKDFIGKTYCLQKGIEIYYIS